MSLIHPKLLEMLVCPACRAKLAEDEPGSKLRCTGCSREYAVIEGIPNMLLEQDTEAAPAEGA